MSEYYGSFPSNKFVQAETLFSWTDLFHAIARIVLA